LITITGGASGVVGVVGTRVRRAAGIPEVVKKSGVVISALRADDSLGRGIGSPFHVERTAAPIRRRTAAWWSLPRS
jgi:hypothetical protein